MILVKSITNFLSIVGRQGSRWRREILCHDGPPRLLGLAELERRHSVVDQLRSRSAQRLLHPATAGFRQIVPVDPVLELEAEKVSLELVGTCRYL